MADHSMTTRAIWYCGAGVIEIRDDVLKAPRDGEVLVEAHYTGVSRGTERLVFSGNVPESELDRMRAPFQGGTFPFPVKYGYCASGKVIGGGPDLIGQHVFALYPHQDRFVIPADMAIPIPSSVPLKRATLAANMETALNALWDGGAAPGDTIIVVGGGIVGLLVTYLCARMPGTSVTLIDPAPQRAEIARLFGACYAPDRAAANLGEQRADIAFHTSATAEGLATAIDCVGFEGSVVELSWFGTGTTPVALGGAFHSQRIRLVSAQVGHVAAGRRSRWSHRRRLEMALDLLADPLLDNLVGEDIAFEAAPLALAKALTSPAHGLAPVIRYAASKTDPT